MCYQYGLKVFFFSFFFFFSKILKKSEKKKKGYFGNNITVAIVDDGVDHVHFDLEGQYNSEGSWNFFDNTNGLFFFFFKKLESS